MKGFAIKSGFFMDLMLSALHPIYFFLSKKQYILAPNVFIAFCLDCLASLSHLPNGDKRIDLNQPVQFSIGFKYYNSTDLLEVALPVESQ